MKLILLLPAALLAACSTTELAFMTGNYGAGIELMKGGGSMTQQADGKQHFRYISGIDVFDKYVPKEQHEEARLDMLSRWLGEAQNCTKGYSATQRNVDTASQSIIYEGVYK